MSGEMTCEQETDEGSQYFNAMSAAVALHVLQHGLGMNTECHEGLRHTAMLLAGNQNRGQMATLVLGHCCCAMRV